MFFDPKREISRAFVRLGTALTAIGVPIGFAIAGYVLYTRWLPEIGEPSGFTWMQIWPPLLITAAIFTTGSLLAARWYATGRRNASFGALVATMFATWLWVWPNIMPIMVASTPFIDLADRMKARLTSEMRADLYQLGSQDPRITWRGDLRFPRLIDQLELLEMQGGERSLAHEVRLYARETVKRLESNERILLVAPIAEYIQFHAVGPVVLAAHGREMPATHIWLLPRRGRPDRYYVVFGNQMPPWEEPRLPERLQTAFDQARQAARRNADELVREFALEFTTTQTTDQN